MTKIGYLGPKGTFSELALSRYIETLTIKRDSISTVDVDSMMTLFDMIEANDCDEIIIAFENSVEGSVTTSTDLLVNAKDLSITCEVVLPIQHALLAKKGVTKEALNVVFSHPQALAQCRRYLNDYLGEVELRPMSSTALAADKYLDDFSAVIGRQDLATIYDLDILETNINDYQQNMTRFIVLSHQTVKNTGNDKTSLIFSSIKDKPGSLVEVLEEFSARGINLTRIESRPTKQVLGEYLFFIDFKGHCDDSLIKEILVVLKSKTSYLRVLGSYPRVEGSIV